MKVLAAAVAVVLTSIFLWGMALTTMLYAIELKLNETVALHYWIKSIESEQRDALWCLYDLQATGAQPDVCLEQ